MAKVYGLIGFPVKHSYSAAMHNAAFQELGIDARYELFEIRPQKLKEGFNELVKRGACGFNVTAPYKEEIIQFLDGLDGDAQLIGAVNTIKINPAPARGSNKGAAKTGFNTDGLGFITHLKKVIGFDPKGRYISILGAGGAAKAVSLHLAQNKAKRISLFDIERNRLTGLADKLRANFSSCEIQTVEDANFLLKDKPDLLINATPAGMHNKDELPIDCDYLYPQLIVYDLIYNPAQTALLREAKKRGCAGVFNGLGMLLYQGVSAFKIWLDAEPPVWAMDGALKKAVSASGR